MSLLLRSLFGLALLCVLLVPLADSARGEEPPLHVDAEIDGPLSVSLTAHPYETELGAPVRITLTAEVASDDPQAAPPRLAWPDLTTLLTEALGDAVVEVSPHRRSAHSLTLSAEVRFFDSGEFDFPAMTVSLLGEATEATDAPTVTIPSFKVYVASVLPPADAEDQPEPVGTRGAVDIPPEVLEDAEESSTWWMWLVGLVLLVGGFLAWRFFGRNDEEQAQRAPPPPPPHERALQALQALLSKHLPEKGDVEPYFVELSEILRRYVEDRFGLRAPEQTTEEFLADLQRTAAGRRAIDSAQQTVLRAFLERADLVKFARDQPGVDVCSEAADAAREFVVETAAPASETDAEDDLPTFEELVR